MNRLLTTTCLVYLGMSAAVNAADLTLSHKEGVLGTSLDISIYGVSKSKADKSIKAITSEILRLEKIFSPKSVTSELSKINAAKGAYLLSPEMKDVLEKCKFWEEKTKNMLNCRLGSLHKLWQKADKEGVEPDRAEVRQFTYEALNYEIKINDKTGELLRPENLVIDPTALAKGYILDRALEKARQILPDMYGIKIDIGGDGVYWGESAGKQDWKVSVSDPFNPMDNENFLTVLNLKSLAIASSGHNSRTYKIGNRSFSHILNPRDGWPVDNAPAATVVAPDAVTADALATALTTLSIKEGLKLIDSLDNVEALIIAPDRRQFPSRGWHRLVAEDTKSSPTVWKNNNDFTLKYEIPSFDEGNYEYPFISIWVTDKRKKLIRSLLVLGDSTRWMEENYVWWRRIGRKFESVVDGVSRPTRRPGEYDLSWDGRDDFGQVAGEGEYILHIEASREHGGHDYQRIPLSLGSENLNISKEAKGEIGALLLKFGPSKR